MFQFVDALRKLGSLIAAFGRFQRWVSRK